MLKEKEKILFTTKCADDKEFVYIATCNNQTTKKEQIVLTYITEEEEKSLDKDETICLKRGNTSFTVYPNLCIAYGEIDLSPNSEHINKLYNSKVFDNFDIRQYMLSNYDYKTHTITSDIKGGRWYDTSNTKTFLPYLYACINKPKRIVIFREYLNNIVIEQIKRERKRINNRKYRENKINGTVNEKTSLKRKTKVSNLKFTIKQK